MQHLIPYGTEIYKDPDQLDTVKDDLQKTNFRLLFASSSTAFFLPREAAVESESKLRLHQVS